MNKIYIHKGDSTIFADVTKFLTFVLNTELDLTGWSATFQLANITRVIDDITSKEFEIILTSEETKSLFLGDIYGSLILKDFNGNIKTISNTIPFCVTSKVIENTSETIDLNIPDSAEINVSIKIGANTVTSINGMTGEVVLTAEDVGALPDTTIIPDVRGLATQEELAQGLETKQPKGDYALISDLTDYVKNTDYATDTVGGVVKISGNYFGLAFNGSKQLYVNKALDTEITNKASYYKPIVPSNLDFAVKTGVTTNTIELTEDEKASAKQWLGYATPTEIMQAIASIPQFKLSIVDELPMTGEKMTLYFVPKDGADNDIYNEYVWIEQTSSYEFLGSTAVDLTDYVKNTDYASGTNAGVVRSGSYYGTQTIGGFLAGNPRTLEQYKEAINQIFIAKGTLENVLTQYAKTVLTTEADYNALETKDANTLYLIEE